MKSWNFMFQDLTTKDTSTQQSENLICYSFMVLVFMFIFWLLLSDCFGRLAPAAISLSYNAVVD